MILSNRSEENDPLSLYKRRDGSLALKPAMAKMCESQILLNVEEERLRRIWGNRAR